MLLLVVLSAYRKCPNQIINMYIIVQYFKYALKTFLENMYSVRIEDKHLNYAYYVSQLGLADQIFLRK